MQRRYLRRQVNFDQFKSVKKARRRRRLLFALGLLLVLGAAAYGIFRTGILETVSVVARLVNPVQLRESEGRINVLVLGLDTRGNGWSGLTDTVLVGSFSPTEGNPVLISLPRDIWVPMDCPIAMGAKKINAAYNCGGGAYTYGAQFDQGKAVNFTKSKVQEILGVQIPYYAVINFEGFKKIVDTLGGVRVTVDTAFTDCQYPTPDYRVKCVSFKAGSQVLNGERALEFARSRHGCTPAGDCITEGSDFARAKRQQKVILGIKDKVLTLDFILNPKRVADLFAQVQNAVKTNVGLGELQRVFDILADFPELSAAKSLVLDTDAKLDLMIHPPTVQYGAYVIIPKAGQSNYTQIHAKVRELLFGANVGPVKK